MHLQRAARTHSRSRPGRPFTKGGPPGRLHLELEPPATGHDLDPGSPAIRAAHRADHDGHIVHPTGQIGGIDGRGVLALSNPDGARPRPHSGHSSRNASRPARSQGETGGGSANAVETPATRGAAARSAARLAAARSAAPSQ